MDNIMSKCIHVLRRIFLSSSVTIAPISPHVCSRWFWARNGANLRTTGGLRLWPAGLNGSPIQCPHPQVYTTAMTSHERQGVSNSHRGAPLQWRHNERDGVSNHHLMIVYSTRRSKKTSKLRVSGLCEGNSPVTDELPAQRASYGKGFQLMTASWHRHSPFNDTYNACPQLCTR